MFSRNFEIQNYKYLDLLNKLEDYFNDDMEHLTDCILDAEVVYKSNDGTILPFQELEKKTTNRREVTDKYPCVYLFDIMHFNNQTLVNKPIRQRKEVLRNNFHEPPLPSKHVQVTESLILNLKMKDQNKSELARLMTR